MRSLQQPLCCTAVAETARGLGPGGACPVMLARQDHASAGLWGLLLVALTWQESTRAPVHCQPLKEDAWTVIGHQLP